MGQPAPGAWFTYRPGTLLSCPACGRAFAHLGTAWLARVRVHPLGKGQPPSSPRGLSHACQRCGAPLDIVLLPDDALTPSAPAPP